MPNEGNFLNLDNSRENVFLFNPYHKDLWNSQKQQNGSLNFSFDFGFGNTVNIQAKCNNIKAEGFVVKSVQADGTIKVHPYGHDECNTFTGKAGKNGEEIASIFLSNEMFAGSYIKDCKLYEFKPLERPFQTESGEKMTHCLSYVGWNQFHPDCVASNPSAPVNIRTTCTEGGCTEMPAACASPRTLELAVSIDKNCIEGFQDNSNEEFFELEMTDIAIETVNSAAAHYKAFFDLDIKIVEVEFVDLNLPQGNNSEAAWEGANNYWHSADNDPNCTNQHDFAVHFSCSRNGNGNGTVGGSLFSGFGAICGTPDCEDIFGFGFAESNFCNVNNYNSTAVVDFDNPELGFNVTAANTLAHELAHGFNIGEGPDNSIGGFQFADVPWCCEVVDDICADLQRMEESEPLECQDGEYIFTSDCLNDEPIYSLDEEGLGVLLDGCDVVLGCSSCDNDSGCFYCPCEEVSLEVYRDVNSEFTDSPIWTAWTESGSEQAQDLVFVETGDAINFELNSPDPIEEVRTTFSVNGENYIYSIPITVLDEEGVEEINPFHESYIFYDCSRTFFLDLPDAVDIQNFTWTSGLEVEVTPNGRVIVYGVDGDSGIGTVSYEIVTRCGDVYPFSFDVAYIGCLERSISSNQLLQSDEMAQEFNLNVYPNPNKGNFTVNFSEEISGCIKIYNRVGILIEEVNIQKSSSYQMIPNSLSPGIYYIECESGGFVKTEKICVLQ